MKTTILNKDLLRLSSVLVLTIGLSSSIFAGPGPQFWAQQAANAKARADAAKNAPTKTAGALAMACPSCTTIGVTQHPQSMTGGKVPAFDAPVGTKHACATCGGAITTTRGKTTSDMKDNCPICTKANPTCCTTGA